MTTETARYPFRDPLNPGAPIIPRRGWDLAPYHRWTFQHIREMTPTAQVWRGEGPVMAMPEAFREIGHLAYQLGGRQRTVEGFLEDSFTDGFLVLHRGAIVAERYFNGFVPHGTHLAMSVTKSIVGLIVGILADRGIIDVAAPVTDYLPELAATAYRGARVQHVLDMTSGVTFDESYTTEGSHMMRLDHACGWKDLTRPEWPRTMWELVLTLTDRECEHGARFSYRSIETDVLGFIVERATGTPLAELMSQEIWAPMGAEDDAYITLDTHGASRSAGGICATVRDLARFGEMIRNDGRYNGRQIVPKAAVADIRGGGDKTAFARAGYPQLAGWSYRNMWWVSHNAHGAFMARGVHGQALYIDPAAEMVIARYAGHPAAGNAANDPTSLPAYHALAGYLMGARN